MTSMTSSRKQGPHGPWSEFDPEAKPEHAFTWRMNAHDRALAKFVAGLRGESVQQALTTLFREGALEYIAEQERRRR